MYTVRLKRSGSMKHVDELLEAKAELEKILDKERSVLTSKITPGFIKNIRLSNLQKKDEIIFARLQEIETKANHDYEKELKKRKKRFGKNK